MLRLMQLIAKILLVRHNDIDDELQSIFENANRNRSKVPHSQSDRSKKDWMKKNVFSKSWSQTKPSGCHAQSLIWICTKAAMYNDRSISAFFCSYDAANLRKGIASKHARRLRIPEILIIELTLKCCTWRSWLINNINKGIFLTKCYQQTNSGWVQALRGMLAQWGSHPTNNSDLLPAGSNQWPNLWLIIIHSEKAWLGGSVERFLEFRLECCIGKRLTARLYVVLYIFVRL